MFGVLEFLLEDLEDLFVLHSLLGHHEHPQNLLCRPFLCPNHCEEQYVNKKYWSVLMSAAVLVDLNTVRYQCA